MEVVSGRGGEISGGISCDSGDTEGCSVEVLGV